MHIDVSNVSSIPNSIKDRIIDEIKSLPGNVVEKIKKQKIKYDIDGFIIIFMKILLHYLVIIN